MVQKVVRIEKSIIFANPNIDVPCEKWNVCG